jgi:SsrA-binding protein
MKVINRRYSREYESLETFEAGIALVGGEVKVAKEGNIRLDSGFIRIIDGQPLLYGVEIPQYKYATEENYDPKRTRQLLLKKDEIERLKAKLGEAKGLTIIPIACYNKRNKIKLEIALSRGRKDLEKRKREKDRDIKLHEKREAKEYEKN